MSMMPRIRPLQIPVSEFRRQYMRPLLRRIQNTGLTPTQARKAARGMLEYLQSLMLSGEQIDLGFVKLVPKIKKPSTIRFNIHAKEQKDVSTRGLYLIGERYVWKVILSEKWLKTNKPDWWPK